MKILIISQYFFPENFRINDVAKGLVEKGHELTVFTGLPNYGNGKLFDNYSYLGPYKEKYAGMKIIRVPLITRGSNNGIRLVLNYLSFAFIATLLAPFLIRGKFDKILVNQLSPVFVGFPAIILKKILKAPIYFWVADLWPDSLIATNTFKSKYLIRLITLSVNFIYKYCDYILVTSRGFIEPIIAQGVKSKKIKYWPQWGENLFLQKEEDYQLITDIPESEFKICFAGNIGSSQSFEMIVDAAEKLKKYPMIHWVILGEGNMKSWVQQEIKNRNMESNFHLLGQRPIESMPSYFSKMNVLLVSLKSDPLFDKTVPGKVQAYLASKKPIIASIGGEGADIIIKAQAGVASTPGDANQLAKSVIQLYEMTEQQRKELGDNGRRYFLKNFEREKLLSKLEEYMS